MKSKKPRCYVVISGWRRGFYERWYDCNKAVYRYPRAVYRGFEDPYEAFTYLQEQMDYGLPSYTLSAGDITKQFDNYDEFMHAADIVVSQIDMGASIDF